MTIKVSCVCGRQLTVAAEKRGQHLRCPACGERFIARERRSTPAAAQSRQNLQDKNAAVVDCDRANREQARLSTGHGVLLFVKSMSGFVRSGFHLLAKVSTPSILAARECHDCGGPSGRIILHITASSSSWSWTHNDVCCRCQTIPCTVEGCPHIATGFLTSAFSVGSGNKRALIPEEVPVCSECAMTIAHYQQQKTRGALMTLIFAFFAFFSSCLLSGLLNPGGEQRGEFGVVLMAFIFLPITGIGGVLAAILLPRYAPRPRMSRKPSSVLTLTGKWGTVWQNNKIPFTEK